MKYELIIPDDLVAELQKHATNNTMTMTELFKKFIRMGLLVLDGHAKLITEQDGEEIEVTL